MEHLISILQPENYIQFLSASARLLLSRLIKLLTREVVVGGAVGLAGALPGVGGCVCVCVGEHVC